MRVLSIFVRRVACITVLASAVGCEGAPPTASQQEALATVLAQDEICDYRDLDVSVTGGVEFKADCLVGRWQGRKSNYNPGNAVSIGCPSNAVVTGLWGKSGQFLDHLGVKCAWIQYDGTLGPSVRWNDAGGNGGGCWFNDSTCNTDIDCPAGWAANGIFGHSGKSVDSVGLECAPFNAPHSQHQQVGPSNSGGGGSPYEVQCGRTNGYNDTSLYTYIGMGGDFIQGFEVIAPNWIEGLVTHCVGIR
jgi:hypothetical protein